MSIVLIVNCRHLISFTWHHLLFLLPHIYINIFQIFFFHNSNSKKHIISMLTENFQKKKKKNPNQIKRRRRRIKRAMAKLVLQISVNKSSSSIKTNSIFQIQPYSIFFIWNFSRIKTWFFFLVLISSSGKWD